jgi:hypothetical protein
MSNGVVPPEKYFAGRKKVNGTALSSFLEMESRVGFHPGPASSGIVRP